ncbi:OmpW family protein [Diaphorobacter ruginosibacter]|uniref:OmpW family protein n=1 Tax=Diaphorobacter ruginosibacter TaxID=1715720 RepID=A0A7G9RNE7_9BURK|nr:OmpW family outer membrane protein [Diaphorobacter ruginosibacter]QNN57122.1 OmpW family protein [Diaphorobacter ruginosibacter]
MTTLFKQAGAALVILAACAAAQAQVAGTISVRAGATRIMPDVDSGNLSAPSFPNTKIDVDSANQFTGGINYMVTDNIALDLPLGLPFKHNFYGDGAIAGVGKLGQVKVIPATLFVQYYFRDAKSAFRPYVGVGVTYAKFFKNRTTATLSALTGGTPDNPTTAKMDNKFGITPQIGFTYNINERWYVDASYYKSFLKSKAHLSTGQSISVKLNPDVVSFGIGYRF